MMCNYCACDCIYRCYC